MNRNVVVLVGVMVAALLLQGCAPKTYVIDAPEPSGYQYVEAGPEALRLDFVDDREDADMEFTSGRLPMGLKYKSKPVEPIEFLSTYTIAELDSRGIDVEAGTENSTAVSINKFIMRNYRTNGYTPFTTVTMLSVDVAGPDGERRVVVFVKRAKVPVWSFDEIVEPTLNQPLELLVQEFAAKINLVLFQDVVADEVVDELIAGINARSRQAQSYLDVYQLGFSNNPRAIPALTEMASSDEEYIRLAAIASLGTINAQDQVELLKSIFSGSGIWQDRAMAIKSLVDLALMGNADAEAYVLQNVDEVLGSTKKADAAWTREIVGLYTME